MNHSEDLSASTDQKNAAIEKALEPIRDDLEKVDLEFRKNLESDVSIISAIGEYVLSSGGKRFRPILLILSAKLCGYQGDRHIPLASLVEFIHTATLLHDDVVDKAEIRRGSASANSKWGNEASVLVGDFLFTKSFSLLVEKGNWEIFQGLSRATTLMAEGELEELIERSRGIWYSCEKGKEYIDRAKRHLHLFEDSEFRQALFTLADYVIERRL